MIAFLLAQIGKIKSALGKNSTDISTLSDQIGTINNKFRVVTSGSIRDLVTPGIYYVSGIVANKPSDNGGLYVVTGNSSLVVGLFVGGFFCLVLVLFVVVVFVLLTERK